MTGCKSCKEAGMNVNQEKSLAARIAKVGLINLVKEHKAVCRGHCDISFILIRAWLEEMGVRFTNEEKELFL